MVEFGVDDKKSMLEFAGDKKGMGSKPLLLFMGDQWESDNLYKSIQNLFIDFFRGDKADKLSLKGVDHALGFTCIDGKIHIRAYNLGYQKSDSKVPNLSMLPMGPFYDLTVRRSQLPSPDMWKAAVQKDKRFVSLLLSLPHVSAVMTCTNFIHGFLCITELRSPR